MHILLLRYCLPVDMYAGRPQLRIVKNVSKRLALIEVWKNLYGGVAVMLCFIRKITSLFRVRENTGSSV